MEQALLMELFISPPPLGESSSALKESCSVSIAGYGRHCELHVNNKTPSHQGSHTCRVVTKNSLRHPPPVPVAISLLL